MFAKLAAVIIAIGACSATLLATRQLRVQAAHELSTARLSLMKSEQELLRVRAAIADRTTPEYVAELARRAELGTPINGAATTPEGVVEERGL